MVWMAATIASLMPAPPDASREITPPRPATTVVAFEDTFLHPIAPDGGLVYRMEGAGRPVRSCTGPDRGLAFSGDGAASCIHPAQYVRATLRLTLLVRSGEPSIAIAHNGMADTSGRANPSPGVEVVLAEQETPVRDLLTGDTLTELPVAVPRNAQAVVRVGWDHHTRRIRVTVSGRTFELPIPDSMSRRGGFALRAPASPETRYVVRAIQVLWEDPRALVLYDGLEDVCSLDGTLLGKLPPPSLPAGMTRSATAAVDLARARSLIVYGGPDLNSDRPETLRGFAVRELHTGRLDLLGARPNGCLPLQGGGGVDGIWFLQSWLPPASICCVDWNAWDRGDREGFITPFKQAERGEGTWTGYHDPGNALDGSMVRYLRITQASRGVNHLTVHPDLAVWAPFGDVAFDPPTNPLVSHTGPAGLPTQLAIRDRDRVWYEEWAFLGNLLHTRCLGYNVFTGQTDWVSPELPAANDAEPYEDFVNMVPDLLRPGRVLASRARFVPRVKGAARLEGRGLWWARVAPNRFAAEAKVYDPVWPVPFQMPLDTSRLLPPPARP